VLRAWTVGGCIASALALFAIAGGGFLAPTWPLPASVFALGVSNGAFAVAAIGSMMALAGHGRERREGVRMGLWGAAQAIAFGLGGFLGTVAIDLTRYLLDSPVIAYAIVFAGEACLFVVAAGLAASVSQPCPSGQRTRFATFGDTSMVELAEGR
jgi:BCD family chlorophyll transporter-like MFS transporter